MTPAVEDKPELLILDDTGHTEIAWDPHDPEETQHARETFDKFKAKGYAAWTVNKAGEEDQVIKTFDPQARRIILHKALRGG